MKYKITGLTLFLMIASFAGYAQCPDYSGDINSLPVCGTYGDANGNPNWNWELTDKNDPAFCSMWYARTSAGGFKTPMSSPFVDGPTAALDIISQNQDFTRAKGWELLQRDFGCSHVIAYPYFVLYNKYSGLLRVFVYQPATQPQYSSILVQIEPTKNPWPATTALGDDKMATPDKFLNSNQAGDYGKMAIAVSENGGSSKWTMAEFNPGFDPNIQNAIYSGTGLKFTLFGVLTNNIKAVIKGRSVSGTDPAIYSFNYVPKLTPSSSNGQDYDFTAGGERFMKFGKSITEIRNIINSLSKRVVDSINKENPSDKSLKGKVKNEANKVKNGTSTDAGFLDLFGQMTSATTGVGNLLKFAGEIIGLFSSGSSKPAAMPTYTSYDLELNGTLTAKTIQQTFILRIPGTVQPNNDNATYFKCPMGIFNIKNTPQADTIKFKRVHHFAYSNCCVNTSRTDYVSYKIRNNLDVSFNSSAGLDLVSAQAAIVGQILPDANGSASYDLFTENVNISDNNAYYYLDRTFNFMRPDLEAGRLEIASYDTEKKLHSFQTPYVNIECLNGLAFNARAETNVFLRIKAILKKKNDPDNTPIIYIKDYDIEEFQGSFDPILRERHNQVYSWQTAIPYSNYTELPLYISDKTISQVTYTQSTEEKADNSIATQNGADIIIPSGQFVLFKAGAEISLEPGFHAQYGGEFQALLNKYGYNITCGSPSVEAFEYTGSCYNITVTALREKSSTTIIVHSEGSDMKLKVFPTITTSNVNITGDKLQQARIVIADQAGRIVYHYDNKSKQNTIQLNLHHLTNGVYFLKIDSPTESVTRKILISK